MSKLCVKLIIIKTSKSWNFGVLSNYGHLSPVTPVTDTTTSFLNCFFAKIANQKKMDEVNWNVLETNFTKSQINFR